MTTLHAALKTLSPIAWSELPTDESGLQLWMTDLFSQCSTILNSIPIADHSESANRPRSSSSSSASNASEISLSSARPYAPPPDHQSLQKEWGKPVKVGSKDNPLGMSVYKLSGKDGRGAWFARRSVHEGLSFSRFKKALEMEFPESLAVQGAPGEGNVRGIGGEMKVEDVKVPGKGRVEVYRLSAQFPGPTTPRDFVTMLVTSDEAMMSAEDSESGARHYMIISKPCDHPDTQPQSGFIRGFYESVEFIREVPTRLKPSNSTTDLPQVAARGEDIGRDAMTRNAQQKIKSFPVEGHPAGEDEKHDGVRPRSVTAPEKPTTLKDTQDINPVEWIMVTRSDPGGSVPRFMVERGTPASICADAEKFLDWACQQDFNEEDIAKTKELQAPKRPERRGSHQSFRSSRMAGVGDETETQEAPRTKVIEEALYVQEPTGGIIGTVSGLLSAYTPQVLLNHLPGTQNTHPEASTEREIQPERETDVDSLASFESADSHLTTPSEPLSPASSRLSMPPRKSGDQLTSHEKELQKLEQRRAALQNKFLDSRSKLEKEGASQSAKDDAAYQKAMERHERDLKKQKEKHEREVKKIEEKQEKERRKAEAKRRKQADKDEKSKLTRERDEARQQLELHKQEADVLRAVVEDLQRQNTVLVARLGRVGLAGDVAIGDSGSTLSRSATVKQTNMGSPSASIKSG